MKRTVLLWLAFFAGPLIWMLSMGARWGMSGWDCAFPSWKPALFVIAAVSAAMVAGSGVMAWTEWRRIGREMPGEGGGAIARSRYLALLAVVLCGFSILVIIAQTIPEIVLGVCE